ncbi:MAG: non-homologous end-joining DNA ligase [Candidatus Dormibacteraeota bacterium]|nr:non-homologous end-joining DNA ligase [Candidatus Dormibacteraeota bacterium]MBO0705909.1 non-homologous end-joining DNA ligase [Candidatus Dormibacteraeota bacterium]MBO0760427.1 non-homologous end-joining DNA ligase [Candidatus Dormibacteraeota bacterium]
MTTIEVGRTEVEVPNPDKELFPADGITKRGLADYYRQVGEVMVPNVAGRPVHMRRFPNGIEGKRLDQKQVPGHFPDWIGRVQIERRSGGAITQAVCNDVASLVYLAGQACITPHTWLSRVRSLEHPDLLVFDLDPSEGGRPDALVTAAHGLREALEQVDLEPAVKSSGSRGFHVVVPLDGSADFDEARSFARALADVVAGRHPDELTTEQRKDKRGRRLFLDTLRNAYGQTVVAPYAVRARPGAPVAAPLTWDEVNAGFDPQGVTMRNVLHRLERRGDPWQHLDRRGCSLREARQRLARSE